MPEPLLSIRTTVQGGEYYAKRSWRRKRYGQGTKKETGTGKNEVRRSKRRPRRRMHLPCLRSDGGAPDRRSVLSGEMSEVRVEYGKEVGSAIYGHLDSKR
jgi:hypothetical protein